MTDPRRLVKEKALGRAMAYLQKIGFTTIIKETHGKDWELSGKFQGKTSHVHVRGSTSGTILIPNSKIEKLRKAGNAYLYLDYGEKFDFVPVSTLDKRGAAMRGFSPPVEYDASKQLTCVVCDYVWTQRGKNLPQTCPHEDCRSTRWNKKAKE